MVILTIGEFLREIDGWGSFVGRFKEGLMKELWDVKRCNACYNHSGGYSRYRGVYTLLALTFGYLHFGP